MTKQELMAAVIASLEKDLQSIAEASTDARKASTEGEAKAEHKYDTRGLEQSYLANGQAKRGLDLMESIAQLKVLPLVEFNNSSSVDISAVVELENENGDLQSFFILPQRGGIKIKFEGKEITTLSPDSSLGENILSKTVGDVLEVNVKAQTISYVIRSIC